MKTKLILTALMLAGALSGFAQKSDLKEYTTDIPQGRNILIQPHFYNKEHVTGKIKIDFVINRKGDVVSASADTKFTTARNMAFVRQCGFGCWRDCCCRALVLLTHCNLLR